MEKTGSGAEGATAETQDETGYYGSNYTLKLAELKELMATSYPGFEGVERDQIVQLIVDEDEDNQIYVRTDIWRNVEKQMDELIGEISKGASGEGKHSFLSLSNWLHKTMRVTSRENSKTYVEAQKQKAEDWHNHQQGVIEDLKIKAQGSKDRVAREIGERKKLQKSFDEEQLTNMQLEATQKVQGESLGEARQCIKMLTEKKNKAVEKLETYQQQVSVFVDIHGKESVVQDGANKADLEAMRCQMVAEVSTIVQGKIEERFASFSASTEARLGKSFDDVYREIKCGVDVNATRLAEFLSQMQSNTDVLMQRLEESTMSRELQVLPPTRGEVGTVEGAMTAMSDTWSPHRLPIILSLMGIRLRLEAEDSRKQCDWFFSRWRKAAVQRMVEQFLTQETAPSPELTLHMTSFIGIMPANVTRRKLWTSPTFLRQRSLLRDWRLVRI
jgi:hypothetical protein